MSKYSICVVGVYFGQLPIYFNLWLKSCEYNNDIDFLIIGDNKLKGLPNNVKCIEMSLSEMREMAQSKLGMQISLENPYKCCDFKVVYGVIFEDYLKEYDFWGHCDFDMIFGDLRKFLTDDILSRYDKVLPLGHLSLYRNDLEVNNCYKLYGSICGDYTTVFTSNKNFIFDEWNGIYNIYKVNNLPMYEKRVFADIARAYTRFRLALQDKNYKHQVFYWQNGKIIRAFSKNNEIYTDEFAYIHFKKRGFNFTVDVDLSKNGIYVCDRGFIVKTDTETPSLQEIKEISPYKFKTEFIEWIIFSVRCAKKWCSRKLKNIR